MSKQQELVMIFCEILWLRYNRITFELIFLPEHKQVPNDNVIIDIQDESYFF